MSLQSMLIKRAQELLSEKHAFQPIPGGQMPMDPAAMGGQPMPMDPAAMGGGAPAPMPMDPAAMGGGQPPMDPMAMLQDPQVQQALQQMGIAMDPASGQLVDMASGQPVDPNMVMQMLQGGGAPADMGGQPMPQEAPMPQQPQEPRISDLTVSEFTQLMGDMMLQVLETHKSPDPADEERVSNKRSTSNTEIAEKLDAILSAIAPMAGGAGAAPVPAGPEGAAFGGQAMPGGMEVAASEQKRPKKNSLVDMIIEKSSRIRGS